MKRSDCVSAVWSFYTKLATPLWILANLLKISHAIAVSPGAIQAEYNHFDKCVSSVCVYENRSINSTPSAFIPINSGPPHTSRAAQKEL